MLDVLNICFPEKMQSKDWIDKMKEMIPSYGKSLIEDAALCKQTRERTSEILKLIDEDG